MSIFSAIGKGLGIASKIIPGPAGAIAGIGSRVLSGGGGPPPGPMVRRFTGQPAITRARDPFTGRRLPAGQTRVATPGIGGAIERFIPGGRSGFTQVVLPESGPVIQNRSVGIAPQDVGMMIDQNGRVCPPRGFRLNKTSYFLRDGTFVPAMSRFVRIRKRNASNGRANDRAIARLTGAQNQAVKVLKATGFRTISKQSSREIRNKGKKTCA